MPHSLTIRKSDQKPLSPEAAEFNKLVARIEKLKEKNAKKLLEMERSLEIFGTEGIGVVREHCDVRLTLASRLMAIYHSKLVTGKRDKEVLLEIMLVQSMHIQHFESVYTPDEFDQFQQQLRLISTPKLNNAEIEMMADVLNDQLEEMGVELDFDIEEWLKSGGSPDEMQEKIKKKVYEKAQDGHFQQKKETKTKSKKNSKKQIEIDKAEKNLNDLYRQLARVFHPDLETDETKKGEKQELMQALNAAYESKNIFSMLQMEIKWLSDSNNRIDKLPEEKLKVFILSLKEQIKILNEENLDIASHPRFRILHELSAPYQCDTLNRYYASIESLKRHTFDIEISIADIGDGLDKKRVKNFLNEIRMLSDELNFY